MPAISGGKSGDVGLKVGDWWAWLGGGLVLRRESFSDGERGVSVGARCAEIWEISLPATSVFFALEQILVPRG